MFFSISKMRKFDKLSNQDSRKGFLQNNLCCIIDQVNSFLSQQLRYQMSEANNLIENLMMDEEQVSYPLKTKENSKAEEARDKYFSQPRILKGSNIFSRLFFNWISCLLSLGYRSTFDTDDLPTLPEQMQPNLQFSNLSNKLKNVQRSKKKGFTLMKAIFRAYNSSFIALSLLALFITILTMAAPVLTHLIITYIKKPTQERSLEEGIVLVIGISAISLVKALLQSHLYYKFAVLGFNLSNTLSLIIYDKALRYPALCDKKYSISEIVNYSQVDAQRMTNMGTQLTSALYTPIQIIIGVGLMYKYIGISFASGMSAMLLMIAITFFVAKKISKVNERTLDTKDKRMKITQEILDIIRFIKVNALQKYFFRKLDKKRSEQLDSNRKRGFLEIIIVFIYFACCPLIIFLTFLTYVLLGNDIDATVAFSTIMIFNILQSPLRQFPSALSSLIQMFTSIKRIQQFLMAPELSRSHILSANEPQVAIRIQNGSFRWGIEEDKKQASISAEVIEYRRKHSVHTVDEDDEEDFDSPKINRSIPSRKSSSSEISTQQYSDAETQRSLYASVIRGINTTISKGKFIVVLGDIGSGKSSFLFAILNQMKCSKRTTVSINGSIAYSAQRPCIISGTVRQNILFTLPYDKRKFQQAIHFASLKQDLKMLIKGEFTEIGEKGTNISGGQKARISLARAIYSERDILLLDDIVSAVDVHVAQLIVKQAVLKHLKGKTVIMPTHAANFAQYADEVIILKKGVITRKGHFNDISQTPEFLEVYQNSMKRQQPGENTGQDRKINLDQIKIKQTINIIKSKRSLVNSVATKSFAEKAIEDLIIPQDHNRGSIDFKIVKQYIKQNGGAAFALIVMGAMGGWLSLSIFSNIEMKNWCKSEDHANFQLYIYLVLAIAASICAFIRAYILVLSGFKQGEFVHKKIIQALLYASMNEFYARVPTGRIMNRLTKDLRELDETIGYAIGNFLTNLFSLIGTLAICIYASSPWMILPAALVMFLCNKLRDYYMKTQRQVIRIEAKTNSPIVSGFVSTIHGLATIRSFQVEQQFLEGQMKKIEINKGARITRQALQSWFAFRLTMLSFCISVLSIWFALINTSISPAQVGLLLSYAFTLNDDIISLTFSWANLETRLVSVERIFNFMKIQPEKAYEQYCHDWSPEQEDPSQIITKGCLQVKDVSVKYRPDLPFALKGLSFRVQPGEKVGVVGRTGAGKSTLFSLLLRIMEPQQGQVLIDGKDYMESSLRDLRSAITIIDQEPVLINSTFRENLDFSGAYTDEQLYTILQECNLYHTVMEKNGLDGTVDNSSLSAGQKQLICICRAFLKKSKLVLIDEATANIDHKNDTLIQEVIQNKFKKSTVLTIAHRLSTLKNCDKILVMGEGKIIQWGSPKQLQQKHGIYAQMVEKNLSQFLI